MDADLAKKIGDLIHGGADKPRHTSFFVIMWPDGECDRGQVTAVGNTWPEEAIEVCRRIAGSTVDDPIGEVAGHG